MEIERVNETTIKFYISYKDIEDRGFDRDEIWYNRERGEELFFEMMNEANDNGEFELEGPLWIQVQALEKGLEIVVTRGKVSDGNVKLEIPVSSNDKHADSPVDNDIVDMLDAQFGDSTKIIEVEEDFLELVIGFADLEDLISLSHSFQEDIENSLYHFEGKYYLYIVFQDDQYTEDEQDDMLSRILEYGYETEFTVHRMHEYGKQIIDGNAINTIRENFPKR
ncbi:adaptor protein MecA [Bacillus sp. FJAT-45350]|uniref:adaptor protein MecA n=1 Tax=Bacillus sp. FJAT-45350 TaxID=2011014 RepID=UPI000BB8A514|nr:adaptor protein MecA [Bacillus sp. FJAT-45350]